MISDNFSHNLLKDNSINCVNLKKIMHDIELSVSVGLQGVYDNLYIDALNPNGLIVKVDGVIVFKSDVTAFKILPVYISKTSKISISGVCEHLSIGLKNAKFSNLMKDYLLPLKNIFVSPTGSGVSLFSYLDENDFLNNELIMIGYYENVIECQTIIIDGVYSNVMLIYDYGVYLCVETDNYTNKLIVSEISTKATIVPCVDNGFYVIYLENGVKCKQYLNGVLHDCDDVSVDAGIIKSFLPVVYGEINYPVFSVEFGNGECGVFVYYNNQFVQIISVKGDFIKLFQMGNALKLCVFGTNGATLKSYVLNETGGKLVALQIDSIKFYNIDNVHILNNATLISYKGNYTKIDEL